MPLYNTTGEEVREVTKRNSRRNLLREKRELEKDEKGEGDKGVKKAENLAKNSAKERP